jgi:8-oxo-dGTP pyrophosphatase MutT (NUDIX family)
MLIREMIEEKAGLIPVYLNNSNVYVRVMIPSDPAYGGSSPQMSKGTVEKGESSITGAIREAEEELGLIASNITDIRLVSKEIIPGMDQFRIPVYSGLIKDPDLWGEPHYETGSTFWLNLTTDFDKIRKVQQGVFMNVLRYYSNQSTDTE